jgi:hypothetical protein
MDGIILFFTLGVVTVATSRPPYALRRRLGATCVLLIPLIITALLTMVPYRLLFHANFERVDYAGMRCWAIGEAAHQLLTYCPDAVAARIVVVQEGDRLLQRLGTSRDLFGQPPQ